LDMQIVSIALHNNLIAFTGKVSIFRRYLIYGTKSTDSYDDKEYIRNI
jgi:hypothetical protein